MWIRQRQNRKPNNRPKPLWREARGQTQTSYRTNRRTPHSTKSTRDNQPPEEPREPGARKSPLQSSGYNRQRGFARKPGRGRQQQEREALRRARYLEHVGARRPDDPRGPAGSREPPGSRTAAPQEPLATPTPSTSRRALSQYHPKTSRTLLSMGVIPASHHLHAHHSASPTPDPNPP